MILHSPTPLKHMTQEELQAELDLRCQEPFWDEDSEGKVRNFTPEGIAIRERIDTIYRIADKRGWELA
jgi:hypothetical protein